MSDEEKNAKAYQQLGRLKSTLREREARLDEMERRLAALEASTAVQFGRLVAGAARNPKRGKRLPKELYRLWRKRSAPVSAAARAAAGGVQPDRVDRPEDRLLVAGPSDVPIIAGVLAPGTAAVLAEHAKVVALYPHDAAIALEAADVDALVVDAAAGEPGGPWAYLGVPGMYDRDLALHEIRRIAAARSLPLVLWGEAPPATLASLHWDATATAPAGLARLLDPAPPPDGAGDRASTSGPAR
ncbi:MULTISPECIES: hypothetical protein [Actinomadura]|uniref:Uncharacterized protein n=1 Tax=Actinomadura citrea TaxID=46158 RepID=A0A7Y9GIK4_9ACTN|nr:hypothetical protein [Actinomadura citrea]NYE17069.1 hypothetical protein [Actinomadura citrea]GGT59909.1 hypothetical protein GCM10010177_15760 [Actinomadura citrea]